MLRWRASRDSQRQPHKGAPHDRKREAAATGQAVEIGLSELVHPRTAATAHVEFHFRAQIWQKLCRLQRKKAMRELVTIGACPSRLIPAES